MFISSMATYLIVIILSQKKNTEVRNVLRNTWLRDSPPEVQHFFTIGTKGLSADQNAQLLREQRLCNDLLLLPTTADSYDSLPHKVMNGIQWIANNANFKFLLKVDDDSFVRLDELLGELQNLPTEKLYWGYFLGDSTVKKSGKWSEKASILCDNYIPYACGGGYVISRDLVTYLASYKNLFTFTSNEDAMIGAVLSPLQITRLHDYRFDTQWRSRGCSNDYIITHKIGPETMKELQRNLDTTGKLCVKEKANYPSYIYNWEAQPSECCARNLWDSGSSIQNEWTIPM